MAIQSKDTINKLGNAMVFFSSKLNGVGKTKLLKLLYLLEECSVKKYKSPFFGIPFKVWKLGPVAKDVFVDLSNGSTDLFKDYVETFSEQTGSDGVIVKTQPEVAFCDDEFSDNDIDILEYVLDKFGSKTANELVKYTHSINSAWDKATKDSNYDVLFDLGVTNSSDIDIDFSYYLSGCDSERYKDILESVRFLESLK